MLPAMQKDGESQNTQKNLHTSWGLKWCFLSSCKIKPLCVETNGFYSISNKKITYQTKDNIITKNACQGQTKNLNCIYIDKYMIDRLYREMIGLYSINR